MSDFFYGELSTDVTAPAVVDHTPTGTGVAKTANITIRLRDEEEGVDTTSIAADVGGLHAVIAGVFQPGFTGTIVDEGGGDWLLTIDADDDFPSLAHVEVTVTCQDLSPLPNIMGAYTWAFDVEDYAPPHVVNNTPTGVDVALDTDVGFDILDEGDGVAPLSVIYSVGGIVAFTAETFVNGFVGTWTPIADGYRLLATPPADFSEWQTVESIVSGADLGGTAMDDFHWSFRTLDATAPVISLHTPTGADVPATPTSPSASPTSARGHHCRHSTSSPMVCRRSKMAWLRLAMVW